MTTKKTSKKPDGRKAKGKRTAGKGTGPERDATTAKKVCQALEYRAAGMTYAVIAEAMGCAVSRAHDLVQIGIQGNIRESAEALIELQLQRLDKLFIPVFQKAVTGDTKAVDTALALMRQMDAYYGIGASKPAGIKAKIGFGETETDIPTHVIFEIEYVSPAADIMAATEQGRLLS
jgi:hypothetical protein